MSDGPLDGARDRAEEVLRGVEHPPLAAAAALAEECGEVSKLLLDHYAYGEPLSPEALGDELADVLICVFGIASGQGISLDESFDRKLSRIAPKVPGWREALSDHLAVVRPRWPRPGPDDS